MSLPDAVLRQVSPRWCGETEAGWPVVDPATGRAGRTWGEVVPDTGAAVRTGPGNGPCDQDGRPTGPQCVAVRWGDGTAGNPVLDRPGELP